MESPEDLLKKVQRVQPDPKLYAAIKQRIHNQATPTTPWSLLKIAAVLCGVLLCVEAYIITNPVSAETEAEDLIALVSVNENNLYDDNE